MSFFQAYNGIKNDLMRRWNSIHQQRLNKTIDSLCFMISQYLILSSIFHSRTTTNGRSQRFNVNVEKSRCSHLGFFGICLQKLLRFLYRIENGGVTIYEVG